MSPLSWRDVYQLVEGSQSRVLSAIEVHRGESMEAHERIEKRLRSLEDDRTAGRGSKAAEARILGIGRSTLALLLALGGLIVQALRS